MAIPLLKLLCQLLVLLSIRFDVGRSYGLLIYRIYHHLREWGMLEVYFMGVLVAIVKLVDLAELSIGLGLFCFISLLLVQVWLEVVMSPHQIWVPCPGRMSMRAIDAGILVCGECHELNRREADTASQTCTRCGAIVHERRPNSIVRTWALLITAMVLYIPANVLPIMTVSALGQGSPDTIMSGSLPCSSTACCRSPPWCSSPVSWCPPSSWWALPCCCTRCSVTSRCRRASAF
jgi:uncharacterized paraquat-inducible protein A